MISEHLVTFKTVDDLQQQNQRLLAVVRELSEEKEKEEHMQVSKETRQLQGRLDEALRSVSPCSSFSLCLLVCAECSCLCMVTCVPCNDTATNLSSDSILSCPVLQRVGLVA